MDRTQCIAGEIVTHRMFVEGGIGSNETDLKAVACGSNSGCIRQCAMISFYE